MKRYALWEDTPASLLTLLLVSAILMTLIAGLFLVVGAILGSLISGLAVASAGIAPFLLISAIVLLIVVIALLLGLLFCTGCFTKDREPAGLSRLLALLPFIGNLKSTLKSLASALQSIETMLTTVETTLNTTTDAVAGITVPSVPVPKFSTAPLADSFNENDPVVGGPIHIFLDLIHPDEPKPRTLSGLTIENQDVSLAFLHEVFSTEPFEQNIETVAQARAQVQALSNLLP